jgi:hypothetical protein
MPSIINASSSGSGGLISTADASGVLQLQSNGTVALTVDASQNVVVGSGSATGTGQLQVIRAANDGSTRFLVANTNAGSSAVSYMLFGNDAYNAGYAGIRATSSTNTTAEFGGAGNGLNIFNNVSSLTLGTGGTTRMTITQSGVTGIQFAPTQVASADANTLDDYEEGTWTPNATSSTGSLTSFTSAGNYTKVGRTVYIIGRVVITSVGSAGGQMNISGLPFATLNTTSRPSVPLAREDAVTGVIYGGYVNSGDTTLTLTSLTFGSLVWSNGYVYTFCFTYQASS